jgi:hypothetical protein
MLGPLGFDLGSESHCNLFLYIHNVSRPLALYAWLEVGDRRYLDEAGT